MAPVKPMLGDLELQPVQVMRSAEEQVLAQHAVPALEGDFFQGLGRRVTRIAFTAVACGDEAGDWLTKLREKFRTGESISFVADITTATEVTRVLIEELTVRERAGKPEQFEVGVSLCEYKEPPQPSQTDTATPSQDAEPTRGVDDDARQDAAGTMEAVENQVEARQGTLEVTVETTDPNADLSYVQIKVQGQTDDGQDYAVVLDQPTNGVFRKRDIPAGQYTVTLLIA